MGDGLLVEFASAVDSVACAMAWQHSVIQHELDCDTDTALQFRIGINLGDVIVEALKWTEVKFESGYLQLEDSKTGQKSIPLNAGALEVLNGFPRLESSDFVFPAYRGKGHYQGTPKAWARIRDKAGLNDVRLHDLRHSFASVAVSGGASLPIIGALLGQSNSATTQRYAHLHDDPLRTASESVGSKIAAALNDGKRSAAAK